MHAIRVRRLDFRMACAAILISMTAAVQADPFQNGSFESPGGPAGTRIVVADGPSATVTGWTNSGGLQVYAAVNGTDAVVPYDGDFYVSFGHSGVIGGQFSQTFDTLPGQPYQATYFVTQQQGINLTQAASVEALDGVVSLGQVVSVIPPYVNNDPFQWFAGTPLNFIATSASTTLRFTDMTPLGGGSNWGLDLVQITPIPEPSACVLLATAVALLGWRARRIAIAS